MHVFTPKIFCYAKIFLCRKIHFLRQNFFVTLKYFYAEKCIFYAKIFFYGKKINFLRQHNLFTPNIIVRKIIFEKKRKGKFEEPYDSAAGTAIMTVSLNGWLTSSWIQNHIFMGCLAILPLPLYLNIPESYRWHFSHG